MFFSCLSAAAPHVSLSTADPVSSSSSVGAPRRCQLMGGPSSICSANDLVDTLVGANSFGNIRPSFKAFKRL